MTQNQFQRLLCVALLALASLLTACGGASSTVNPLRPDRVIAFGDGFNAVDSDGFGVTTVRGVVGTDFPDDTIAGRMAYLRYGITLWDVPAAQRTSSLDASKKGFSYAQGLARIQDSATPVGVDSVEKQIDKYLTANRPGEKDLFIITAGSLDIYDASINNTSLASPVTALVNAIKRLTDSGAKYVLIVYPPNMARTPWGIRKASAARLAVQDLSYDTGTSCTSFSCRTTIALNLEYPATSAHQPILLADLMGYSNLITGTAGTSAVTYRTISETTTGTGTQNTFVSYAVANPDLPACFNVVTNQAASFTPPAATLTCDYRVTDNNNGVNTGTNGWTSATWNYTNSVFADNFYFTPFANRLYADYIYNVTMLRAGWR